MEESQNHLGKFPLKDLYNEWIEDDLDHIRFIHSENKVFQEIRENHQDNWKIVELCREALFDNAKLIKFLRKEIEDVRAKIKAIG
jgi:hypothetical protein